MVNSIGIMLNFIMQVVDASQADLNYYWKAWLDLHWCSFNSLTVFASYDCFPNSQEPVIAGYRYQWLLAICTVSITVLVL